jgi:hypothetical protein
MMERELKINRIAEVILNELYCAECESCTWNNKITHDCTDCSRQYCDWLVSDEYARYVAELIIDALEKE